MYMINTLHNILFIVSEYIILFLETVGIFIIAYGGIRGMMSFIRNGFNFGNRMTLLLLTESISLSLTFKLGAEIIKTVMIRDIEELLILSVITILRILITFVVHWEMKSISEEHPHHPEIQNNSEH